MQTGDRRMRRWLALLIVLLVIGMSLSQDDACPALQNEALASLTELCAAQEAGTLCLGHDTVTPVLRGRAEAVGRFNEPGDAIAIDAIDWLSVSSEDRTWGLARALFPAYAEDSLEARDAALLAVGNVALFFPKAAERPETLSEVKVAAARGANLRARPSTAAPVIAKLALSRELGAIGRSANGNWLLIYATPELRGWISRSVVSAPLVDLPALPADADAAPLWLPWQRFDFHSGMGDAPCPVAPASGILLQTPKLSPPRHFQINGARIALSGTAWLQAQVSRGMLLHVIDGRSQVATDVGAQNVRSGKYTAIALNRNDNGELVPVGAPAAPQAYDYHALTVLPVAALPSPAKVGLDVYTVAEPAPAGGGSPLEALPADAPCKFSALLAGANVRSRPDPNAPVIAVMAYRESAEPLARGIGVDRLPWWKLSDRIWVRVDATVAGGNCNALPLIKADS